ncbi:putative transcriptional regulator YdeE [Rhizomicrobium palustre]|uniref:Putative transcriptional regulator YdeE n=2 Tax=Rhizomicrobium palustre TaxID=189966 RepID=A0A846MZG6_9PROT|nr:putative transcriptional regulator YdeE [Rhizomicrobium palustre]
MADGETKFNYFCGAPQMAFSGALPDGLSTLELPLMNCAVFPYLGHVLGLGDFVHYILRDGLREAGLQMVPSDINTPEFCERYGAGFDPGTLIGNIEVIVPVL